MSLIGTKQKEWAALKYFILAKSQTDYREIRKLFQEPIWNEEKEKKFQELIDHAMSEPPNKGNRINAYQHIWGYFKKKATPEERRLYEHLVATYTVEQDELHVFLKQLTIKYQESYLLESFLLFGNQNEKIK